MCQGQEAPPRERDDPSFVRSPMERQCEIDRGLARADKEHRVAARETVEDARVPGVPNIPFTLKGPAGS